MRNIKTVKQHDAKDCGAACLCTISQFFGKKHSLYFMREMTHTSQNGVTLLGISEGAEKIGICADAYESTLEELETYLKKNKIPVIAHLKANHFVVIYKVNQKQVFVSDPASGKYRMNAESFREAWSGYLLLFSDLGKDIDQEEDIKNIHLISNTVKKHWKELILISLLSWFTLGVSLCSSYLFQTLLDYGNIDKHAHAHMHDESNAIMRVLSFIADHGIARLFAFMVFLTITMVIFSFIRGKLIATLSRKIDISYMDGYVTKILKSSTREISTRMTGDYISRSADLMQVRSMISNLLVSFLFYANFFIIGSILLFRINVLMFGITIITLFLYCGLALILRKPFYLVNHAAMSANAAVQTYLKESIQGIEFIKANNIEDNVRSYLLDKHKAFVNKLYKGNILNAYSMSGVAFIEQISNLIIIFIGFEFVHLDLISLGELMTFFMLVSLLTESAKQLTSMQQGFQSGLVAIERLNDVNYMKEEQSGEVGLKQIQEIRAEGIGFSYPGYNTLFRDVSFSLSGNEKIAIIGENGCGKSTLLKLIMGMEKSTEGTIYVNGSEIGGISIKDYRDRVAFVTQNVFLFANTLLYNITLGQEYSEEEIQRACKLAGLLEFIHSVPQGLNMFIDENAINLSAGQKQSIALARAIIKNPDVLILDEATSNMDYEKENLVINGMMNLDIPCLFVTHNKEIIARADSVIRLG